MTYWRKLRWYEAVTAICLACAGQVWIRLYPRIKGCEWPLTTFSEDNGTSDFAPFRLLTFADPQIEGDTKAAESLRAKIDLWGNDYYLRHIYKTMVSQVQPPATHSTLLGDLMGSQWVDDREFARRAERLEAIFTFDTLDTVFNITGNHDIGYSGEMTPERVDRFERVFGKVNYMRDVRIGDYSSIRVVVLNTLNMDSPSTYLELQYETHSFLESLAQGPEDDDTAILLLTHVPLHKAPGVCVDKPSVELWWEDGPIQEQNHISQMSSEWILDRLFLRPQGGVRNGLILTGHDHEGCDVIHYLGRVKDRLDDIAWKHQLYDRQTGPQLLNEGNAVREVTVRSMMGDFDGNVGLVAGRYDNVQGEVWLKCLLLIMRLEIRLYSLPIHRKSCLVDSSYLHMWTGYRTNT